MAERTPLIAANWKMHKTVAETAAFLDALLPRPAEPGAELVVCPPFTALAAAVARCAGSGVRVAAQNMHSEPEGPFTGEIAAPMLTELGVDAVILGHSERRQLFAESDEALARKVPAALEAGLMPILCVGETDAERDADQTEAVLRRQLEADLAKRRRRPPRRIVIAYEPVWAIGTGRMPPPTRRPRRSPSSARSSHSATTRPAKRFASSTAAPSNRRARLRSRLRGRGAEHLEQGQPPRI